MYFFLDYGYGYEAPPAPVSATRGRGNFFIINIQTLHIIYIINIMF